MQSKDPLNTIALQQFIQQVRNADSSKQKEIRITIDQAKKLAFTLSEVMIRVEGDLEELLFNSRQEHGSDAISITVDGGNGWGDK